MISILLGILSILQVTSSNEKTISPPKHYFVFGDRYAGVQYLNHLIGSEIHSSELDIKECRPIKIETQNQTMWRYGFFDQTQIKQELNCQIDDTLFIMIVKDPFAWFVSVAQRKFTNTKRNQLRNIHIQSILSDAMDSRMIEDLNGHVGNNPQTQFSNIMIQRNTKLKKHFHFLSNMKHSYLVR